MDKVLILGANGLLGQSLIKRFSASFDVVGASLEEQAYYPQALPYRQVDLTDRSATYHLLEQERPDVVINAAAYTDVDGSEENRELCWKVNVHAVEHVIDVASALGMILVHISTDYVFDGERGLYREKDSPAPRGVYARSKLAAENVINASDVEYIIARTQVLFGYGRKVRPNFVTWVINSLKKGQKIRVVTDQVGNPTYVPDLAEGIYRLLEKEAYGLFHISGPDIISRYDFAVLIANVFGLDESLIQPITTEELGQKAPRPMNSSFKIDKLVNYTGWEPAPLEMALQRLKKEMEQDG